MSADFRPQYTLLLAFPNLIDLYTYLAYTCTHALVIAKFGQIINLSNRLYKFMYP